MTQPKEFRAKGTYRGHMEKKANRNLPMMARVGNGGGVVATGRANFYWIRLVNDDNRLTQCYSLLPLADDDYIYVRRARDRALSYYEFDKFIRSDGGDTAPPTQIHDHHDDFQGGPDLNPETISTRTLIVGTGCTYTTLEAAVAAVPGTPCTIKVMGITTTEVGDVTVPSGVTVKCMGEGSIIGMGANVLHMSDNSYMQDVVFTGSGGEIIEIDDVTGVVLRNVKAIQSAASTCFHILEGSNVKMYHCIAEATAVGALGFNIENTATATVYMKDCEADDDTHFTYGIVIGPNTCHTDNCTFSGYTKDVLVAAGATWEHIKCNYDANNTTILGVETPLPDGAVEIATTAIYGHSNLYPNLGALPAAQRWGNIYLSRCCDIYPDYDEYPFWNRSVNFGVYCPDEHWHQGADELAWVGWAGYVGYATPNSILHDYSQKRVRHNAATHAFYYRAAATGNDIYLRQGTSLWVTTTGAITLRAGVMIDDGVDAADGLGANNYYRVMVEATGLTTNWNIRREYRIGGGAPVAAVTAYSLPPGDFYCPVLVAVQNPDWTNWWAGMYYRRTNARETLVQFDNPPFAWTPAYVGIYYYVNGANNGFALWDWYDEATS